MRSKKPISKKEQTKRLVWSLTKADTEFSKYIRDRDLICQFPLCSEHERLQCSHWKGRAKNSTRFDPDNCVALCYSHHYGNKLLGFEYQKQELEKHGYDGQYTIFMKKRLGDKYKDLIARSNTSVKQSDAIAALMKLLGHENLR